VAIKAIQHGLIASSPAPTEGQNMKKELTEKLVAGTTCKGPRLMIRDTKVTDFAVRIGKRTKTFVVACRDREGKMRTVAIGLYPEISVKEARDAAARIRSELRGGGKIPASVTVDDAPKIDPTTLQDLLIEAEAKFSRTLKSWRLISETNRRSSARRSIESVFKPLLDKPVESLTAHDLAEVVANYRPQGRQTGQTGSGHVSGTMSYLATVLNWAAHRKRFRPIGAGRQPKLNAPDIREVFDPKLDDPTITGLRTRVLTIPEFTAIFPLLTYPRPASLERTQVPPEEDYAYVALRFVLLTAARLSEVTTMKWGDVDWLNGVWMKPDTKGFGTAPRKQSLPLSDKALDLLGSLPRAMKALPSELVFPNANGGLQMNWDRAGKVIQAATGTSGWTRHDLRRTAATVMLQAGIPVHIIETILNHASPIKSAGGGGASEHYMVVARMWTNEVDPVKDALDRLAATYDRLIAMMEARMKDRHRHQ